MNDFEKIGHNLLDVPGRPDNVVLKFRFPFGDKFLKYFVTLGFGDCLSRSRHGGFLIDSKVLPQGPIDPKFKILAEFFYTAMSDKSFNLGVYLNQLCVNHEAHYANSKQLFRLSTRYKEYVAILTKKGYYTRSEDY